MPTLSRTSVAVLCALVAGVAAGALLAIGPVRDALGLVLQGDLSALRSGLRAQGAVAAVVLVGLALLHVLVPFPAELPTAAAGFALGFAVGFPLMLGGWALSGLAAYGLARLAGRPLLVAVLGEHRLERAERLTQRAGTLGLVGLRLVPLVPFNLVCFACGVTRVPLARYMWTTVVGFAPLTAVCVLLGARLQTPSLNDPVLWALLAAGLALVALARPVHRRLRAREPDGEPGARDDLLPHPRPGG